ncbi:MAG: NAD(P)-dependent oxidoreductase [Muribaculaceae bacterium]|nr:NAD(P)-dependent oxidoreductase [Muribaculaceae bacterium]
MKKTVFITGATGAMGYQTLKELSGSLDKFNIRLLVRQSKKNRRKLAQYLNNPSIHITWGNLLNYEDVEKAMGDADIVLHIGGMVSPAADHLPELTMKVNTTAAENIVRAVKSRSNADEIRVVYIGSVAQTAHHWEPHHWGRTGDPIMTGIYDVYGISKIIAEKIFAESGLKHWVSLRQSGILANNLIKKGSDPITFHVPLRGVLEWATVEDSGRLMAKICESCLPGHEVDENFWRGFYNIGSGPEFRLTNYEFEVLLLKALKCPPVEKCFEPEWFATRNFHGEWYEDSHLLEDLFHFRENITAEEYFDRLAKSMPWWMTLTPLAPASLVKFGMKMVANIKDDGPLNWFKRNDCEHKIKAYFRSREAKSMTPGWKDIDLSRPGETPIRLDHGYDESKPISELDIYDMRQAAEFRGGKCLSKEMTPGDLDTPLEWECAFGHKFTMRPRTVLKGGHWCPECLPKPWRYNEEAKKNKFMAQIWYDSFSPTETEEYN